MSELRALLIGVPDYDDSGITDLSFIREDFQRLSSALSRIGYECLVQRYDRTDRESLDQAVEAFLLDVEPGASALIVLSGHGIHYGGADYLVTSPVRLRTRKFPERCLKISFNEWVEESRAQAVTVVVDACREGIELTSKGGIRFDRWGTAKRRSVRSRQLAYIYACSPDEVAQYAGTEGGKFSVFTRALCEVIESSPDSAYNVEGLREALQGRIDAIVREYKLQTQRVRISQESPAASLPLVRSGRAINEENLPSARTLSRRQIIITASALLGLSGAVVVINAKSGDNSASSLPQQLPSSLTIAVGARPNGVAIMPDGKAVYVANYASDSLTRIDTRSNLTSVIRTDLGPNRLAITPDNRQVYVANSNSNTVEVVDTSSGRTTRLVVGVKPDDVVSSADGSRVYVTNNVSNTLSIIDTAASAEAKVVNVPVGQTPYDMVIGRGSRYLYVSNNGSNSVSVVDSIDQKVVSTIPVGQGPYGLAVTPDGREIFVANNKEKSVSVIEAETNRVSSTIPIAGNPIRVAISADGRLAYAVASNEGIVEVIDIASRNARSVRVGANPQYIVVSLDSRYAYVGNYGSGSVSEINTSTGEIKTAAAGPTPLGMDITSDGSRLYVANDRAGTVTSLGAPFN